MSEPADDERGWDEAAFRDLQDKAEGSNLDPTTLLATDYLNHFNEIVMLLEMVPDMPEILDEAREWTPKDYKQHFLDSSIADRDIAVEAYDHVPPRFKEPFEKTVSQIDSLIATSIDRLEHDLRTGNMDLVRENTRALTTVIQKLMDTASAIIHGSSETMAQSEIDILLGQ